MLLFPDYKPNYVLTKPCRLCGKDKPLSLFPGHHHHQDDLDSRCYDCIKKKNDEVKEARKHATPQPDRCECCGKVTKKLHLDHDKTGFRGWLCHGCNTGIGALGDNIEGILRALDYLIKHELKLGNTDILQKTIDYLLTKHKEVMS
jgi:hypothetical protein